MKKVLYCLVMCFAFSSTISFGGRNKVSQIDVKARQAAYQQVGREKKDSIRSFVSQEKRLGAGIRKNGKLMMARSFDSDLLPDDPTEDAKAVEKNIKTLEGENKDLTTRIQILETEKDSLTKSYLTENASLTREIERLNKIISDLKQPKVM